MSQITIEIPEETLLALRVSNKEMAAELRMAAAVKLYEIGKLSSGAAATVAGIARTAFHQKLADYGVDAFRMIAEDLASETPLA